MNLNDLIHIGLTSEVDVSERLASYEGCPAVFVEEFPNDQSAGWGSAAQYPRICFRADRQIDQKRSSSGVLHVAVYTMKETLDAEYLESAVRKCFKDILMIPDEDPPFCVSWLSTEPYSLGDGSEVICQNIEFDIIEFPSQETTDPDPIMSLSGFIKDLYDDSLVIGLDRLDIINDPHIRPIFYVDLQNMEQVSGHCEHSVVWFNATMSVHILCPDEAVRLKMAAALTQKLRYAGEVIMDDLSPMTIAQLSMNTKADYVREGQITVTGKYGCLRERLLSTQVYAGADLSFD